jgi:hypothetical protein
LFFLFLLLLFVFVVCFCCFCLFLLLLFIIFIIFYFCIILIYFILFFKKGKTDCNTDKYCELVNDICVSETCSWMSYGSCSFPCLKDKKNRQCIYDECSQYTSTDVCYIYLFLFFY